MPRRIYLVREPGSFMGTPGVLVDPEGGWSCFSLELPWHDNLPDISCIPCGEYLCSRYFSRRFSIRLYGVKNVPRRSGIAIHSGNLAGDRRQGLLSHSAGCILLGRYRGCLWGQDAVLVSRPAVAEFERRMDGDCFHLVILSSKTG